MLKKKLKRLDPESLFMHLHLNFTDKAAKVNSLGHGNMKRQISLGTNQTSIFSFKSKKLNQMNHKVPSDTDIPWVLFFLFKESRYI